MTGNCRRILVIEDNPTNLDLLMFLLRASGHIPFAARDGVAGLRRALELLPELIICDIQLPTIDGYEVARRMKSHEELRRITLIAVTACAMPTDRERALAAGFDGYITKPIAPYTFCDEISRYLPASEEDLSATVVGPVGERTVLVAEHIAGNLDVLGAVLGPVGRPYTVARTVAQSLDQLRAHGASMIIAELDLPGGGAEMLLGRTSNGCEAVPTLVLVPAATDEQSLMHLRGYRQCQLMRWPIEPAALLQWIDALDAVTPMGEGVYET